MRLTPAASIRYTLHICRELIFLKNCKWEGKCIQLVRGHTECQLQESKYVCKGNLTKNTSFESTELLMCTMLQDIYSADDTGPRLILVKKKHLLFYTPVTCSLPLLPLVSSLLLMLLVLWSQSSFLTSVHGGTLCFPRSVFCLNETTLVGYWSMWVDLPAPLRLPQNFMHRPRSDMCTQQLTNQNNFLRLT